MPRPTSNACGTSDTPRSPPGALIMIMEETDMKKRLSVFLCCMLLMPLLFGLVPAALADDPVVLQLICSPEEAAPIAELVEILNKTYPQVSIEPIIASTPDQYNSIMSAKIASKNVPDLLVYQSSSVIAMYASQGIIADLTDTGLIDRVSAGDKRRYSYKNQVFAIPLDISVAGVIVNMDVMEEYGISTIPKTLAEFVSVCEEFRQAGLEYPVIVGGKELSPASQYVYQSIYLNIYGSNPNWYIDVLEGKNSWNGAEMQKVMAGYAAFRDYIIRDTLGLDFNGTVRRLALGEGAYMINNASALSMLREANPEGNFMVIPPPWIMEGDDTLANSDYDTAISMSATTEHPEECLAFLDLITSKDGAAIYNNAVKTYPSVLGANVALDPALSYCFENYIGEKKNVGFYSRQWVPGVQDIMKKSVQDWLGGMDVIEALNQIETEHQRLMEVNAEYVKDFLADNPRI